MSRTFRRDEFGNKAFDSRRAKKREKNSSHWSHLEDTPTAKEERHKSNRNYNDYDLDN
jgi:hypothetical protein